MSKGRDLKQGFGEHSMWGLSPSYNLLQRKGNSTPRSEKSDSDDGDALNEINILLVKPGDIRHLIHTLGQRYDRESGHTINIFLLESEMEVLARHLLQLYVFLGTGTSMVNDENANANDNGNAPIPIRHRSAMYLELYNTLISKKAQAFVSDVASKDLCDFVYECDQKDERGGCQLKDLVDLTWSKQKERDHLFSVFDSWKGDEGVDEDHDIAVLREHRLRGFYADRYDW